MIDFSGISLPFNVSDLLSSGMSVFGLVAAFVLLGLAFKFVPQIFALIRVALFASHTDSFGNVYNKNGMPIKYAKGEKKRLKDKYGDSY